MILDLIKRWAKKSKKNNTGEIDSIRSRMNAREAEWQVKQLENYREIKNLKDTLNCYKKDNRRLCNKLDGICGSAIITDTDDVALLRIEGLEQMLRQANADANAYEIEVTSLKKQVEKLSELKKSVDISSAAKSAACRKCKREANKR